MDQNILIADEMVVITLLLIAIITAIALRHLKMPYTIGLVITGFLFAYFIVPHISSLKPLEHFTLNPDIVLYLFLPLLIFESAIALNTRLLSRNLFPVLSLAILGVIISAVIIGILLSHVFAIPILFALLFGALISATDPAAVISIFKEVGVPKRLQILVEGESLLNDAAAIVMFQLVLSLITAVFLSEKISVLDTTTRLTSMVLISFIGGILVGTGMGLLLTVLIKRTPLHPYIHQTVTIIAAYLSYLISDHLLGFSGVIAVVVCGCLTARASSDWLGPASRDELTRFWEYIGFLANSLIFLLVGIAIASLQDISLFLSGAIMGIALLIAIVTIARFIPVFGIFWFYNLFTPRKVPFSYQMISFWGGLRGAVAIALSLSLNPALPYRDTIIAFSLTIVLFTILAQGLTIGPLIHLFGLGQTTLVNQFHRIYTDLATSKAGGKSLQSSPMNTVIDTGTAEEYAKRYQNESAIQVERIRTFWNEVRKNPEKKSILRLLWLEAIRYEQKKYRLLYDEGLILPAVYSELQYQTAIREDLIQSGDYHPGETRVGPGTRLRYWIQRSTTQVAPGSRISRYLLKRDEINRIFVAAAVMVAAAGTIQYLKKLAASVYLNYDEIKDILAVYTRLEAESKRYLHSEGVRESGNLKEISVYLAERTAKAGMIEMLHRHLEDGTGDGTIINQRINQLIDEKNEDRKRLIQACNALPPE